ncbi:polysaccharide deacetylase family protein [Trebonia kvetii]|uniref:Polysaccharide deacetylase family protein n=1 Tax=Trebonia kvetii TaxID=2480626 RepID=A0A6P2C202_9ACTN|nr:polysaccharide deacetylase family protein [Trebonia kvetii]TVZ04506.1 polysaccharide deacetylase family protein [Trebonia kvetii]
MFTVRSIRFLGALTAASMLAACAVTPAAGAVHAKHPGVGATRTVKQPFPGKRHGGEGPAGPPAKRPGGRTAKAPAATHLVSAGCTAAPYGANFYAPDLGAKTVALTFDDGPGPSTPGILAVLREHGVPATFLNIGQNAAAYPALVREEASHGFLVGNHTWNHPNMPGLSAAAQAVEMDEASAEQEKLIGWGPCVFRPPYGNYNATLLSLAQQRGMAVWMWSVDTEDWKADGSAASSWVNRIISLAESEGGGQLHPVVLMHNAPSGDPATVAALPTIISYFRMRGYTFVNLAGDTGTGYYVATSAGAVHGYRTPRAGGSVGGRAAGLATDPDTGGYWLLKANGSVVAHNAPFYGQLSGRLPRHVTAVAIAADHGGYLVLTSDGGVHAFGAPYHGQPKGRMGKLKPVGLAADAATGGYWILNSGGGVWTYDATDYGSLAGKHYQVTAIAASAKGGYLLLTAAGRVFGFHADMHGSPAHGVGRGVTAVALAVAPATGGYLILLSNGHILGYGARTHGSPAAGLPPHQTATAIAAA